MSSVPVHNVLQPSSEPFLPQGIVLECVETVIESEVRGRMVNERKDDE